jgi:glyoxylase-like metal-dependent hydrolase (beta-lactamase superfamily II)
MEFKIGKMTIVKVPELELPDFTAPQLLPGINLSQLTSDQIDKRIVDPSTERVPLSVHSWLVRKGDLTILVDTGVGNDKSRPGMELFDHLNNPYLENLASLGIQRDQVLHVLLTHIHADHVGWNTINQDGHWLPTFPTATIICSELEGMYGVVLAFGTEDEIGEVLAYAGRGKPVRRPTPGVFDDSIVPVDLRRRLTTVQLPTLGDSVEILPDICYLPTPGHSIDHAAISITSEGETAIFGGDVLHHPFEIDEPDLLSAFCEFPDRARECRRWFLEYVAESGATYFSSHFGGSSAGYITRKSGGYKWEFAN